MTVMPRWIGVIFLALATSCGMVTGLDDLKVYGGLDASAPDDDGAASTDDGFGVTCTPTGTVEVCEDGIDNDCNGAIDCADYTCAPNFLCVPEAPQGWTIAAAAASATPACPPLIASSQDLTSAVADSAASCSCTCDTTDPACSKGAYTFTFGASCGSAPASLDPTATCGSVSAQLAKDSPLHLQPPAPPSTCAPNLKKTIPPPQKGRLCQGAAVGAGCDNGAICVPRVQAPLQNCVTQTGDQACPTSYPIKIFAGTGVQSDTRDCAACTCQSGTCSATATFYEGPTCNGRSIVVQSSLVCATPGNDPIGASSYALGQFAGGCAVAQKATLTGTLTLTDQRTICCRQ